MAGEIEPCPAVEADSVDDEFVAFPVADGIAEPRGLRIRGMRPAIEENLAIAVNIAFKQEVDAGGRGHNLPGIRRLPGSAIRIRQRIAR